MVHPVANGSVAELSTKAGWGPGKHPSTIQEELVGEHANGTSSTAGHHSRLQQSARWPSNLDMKTALARCEDASLSWSLQFWVTLADPVNQSVFFANPATGQCSWEPPVGAYVVPRSPDGEWWELADSSRANRSYYYNTVSGKTQWTRPEGDVMVIPLGLIQNNALPEHSPPSTPKSAKPQARQLRASPTAAGRFASPTAKNSRASNSPLTPASVTLVRPIELSAPQPSGSSSAGPAVGEVIAPPPPRTPTTKESDPLDAKASSSHLMNASPGWLDRLGLASPGRLRGRVKSLASQRSISRPNLLEPTTPGSDAEGADVVDNLGRTRDSQGRLRAPDRPIQVSIPVKTKRLSTGLHPVLPSEITSQIQSFQGDDFAQRYFATRRTGFLRKRVPMERLMQWQKNPIGAPLLVLNRTLWKDALLAFKAILYVMRDRTRAVDGVKPVSLSASAQNMSTMDDAVELPHGMQWEGVRWLVQLGASTSEVRDELYCQVIKQLVGNRNEDSVFLGFQLMCVFVVAFGPSKNFEPYVRDFLKINRASEQEGIAVMAKYCLGKLEIMSARGGRGKTLTQGEIENAADAAFNPSVFGESLSTIMQHQEKSYPALKVPIVLPFLADGILALGGLTTEGTFRVSGDAEVIAELKARMDRGHYQLTGVDDPHVLASLFKLFLRDLETPLIPSDAYNAALEASGTPQNAIDFVKRLPTHNRRVLVFVISFLQKFTGSRVVKTTKMTSQNLALVLAPNILRTTSDSLVTVINNASFEAKFIHQLLLHAPISEIDTEYVPKHAAVDAAPAAPSPMQM